MKQYIEKSALVAEIEKIKHKLLDHIICERDKEWAVRTAHQLNRIIWLINDLEVKENDLVEEIDYEDYIRFFKEHPEYSNGDWGFEETWVFAQYCYTLGLKAQKGE